MFSTGQLVFAILFFISFLIIVTMSYRKDLKGLKGSYSGIRWVIIGFISFVTLLVVLKNSAYRETITFSFYWRWIRKHF